MGGGGQSGGTVVQSTAPFAAIQAGNIGVRSAGMAQQLYQQQAQNAIQAINNSYQSAATGLAPYTQTGIEALDQMNQLMGLDSYKPMAPTSVNAKDYLSDYINNNTEIAPNSEGNPIYNYYGAYAQGGGYSAEESARQADTAYGLANGTESNHRSGLGILSPGQADLIQAAMEKDPSMDPNYKAALDRYNMDLNTYNVAQKYAEKYGAKLTPDQVTQQLASQPGYQFTQSQGIDQIMHAGSAAGGLGGNTLQALANYTSGLAQQTYGATLSRLAALAGAGQSAATTLTSAAENQGNNLASLYTGLGTNNANAALSAGNSLAQGITNANQQFNVVGGQDGGMGGFGSLLGGAASLLGSSATGGRGLMGLLGMK